MVNVKIAGYNKCPAAMDFHHRDPNEKDYNIGTLKNSKIEKYNKKRLEAELDKCDLLCSNCHREEHARLIKEQDDKHLKFIEERYKNKDNSTCNICNGEFEKDEKHKEIFLGELQEHCSIECYKKYRKNSSKIKPNDDTLDFLFKNFTVYEIADKFEVCRATVYHWRTDLSRTRYNNKIFYGYSRHKKPDNDILVELLTNYTSEEIAEKLNVSLGTVSTWRYKLYALGYKNLLKKEEKKDNGVATNVNEDITC